jgi:hypothetical protein
VEKVILGGSPLVPARARPAWAALIVGALLFSPFAAGAASASCRAALAGTRALVGLTLEGLLDHDLLRLVRLGLAGKLSIEVTVVRRRFLLGSNVARAVLELELRWSEAEGLLLDGRPVRDPEHLSLERIALALPEGLDPTALEVETRAELRVVTAQSLTDVARWIAGDDRSTLSKNLIGAVADDLTRSADARCPVTPVK